MREIDLGAAALWLVALPASAFGIASALVFAHFADFTCLRQSWKRLQARFLELRLFAEDPLIILRSQRDLLIENARLLGAIALPLGMIAPVSLALAFLLNHYFAQAGLMPGQPAVITVQMTNGAADRMSNVQLSTDRGMKVETGPVRVLARQQVSWRISPVANAEHGLTVWDGNSSTKVTVAVGSVSAPTRVRSNDRRIAWIKLSYPPAVIYGRTWMVWFFVFSCAGAVFAAEAMRLRTRQRSPKLLS